MKSKIKDIMPIIFLIYGLLYFLEPVASAWFEIVNPFIARNVFLPLKWIMFLPTLLFAIPLMLLGGFESSLVKYANDILFLSIFFAYLLFYFKIDHSLLPRNKKTILNLPLFILPLLFILLIPLGFTSGDRRVATFPLGGRFLLWTSGGSSLLRSDAINMMNATQNEEPLESEIPDSIKKINAWVGIEHHNRLVVLYLGRMFNMADGFGFLFLEENTNEPNSDYVNGFDFQRLWKLDEGVYFYEID
ncbi:MAG: hypothetical protein KF758_18130 [Anaerolineales bacterium]|nr:hypothetical protein [Anaerolineales bacterium]